MDRKIIKFFKQSRLRKMSILGPVVTVRSFFEGKMWSCQVAIALFLPLRNFYSIGYICHRNHFNWILAIA